MNWRRLEYSLDGVLTQQPKAIGHGPGPLSSTCL
jgi:hypothetical protein